MLHDLSDEAVACAKEMVTEENVIIGLADTELKLYVKAMVEYAGHVAYAVIENDHDNIVETGFDNAVVSMERGESADECPDSKSTLDYGLTVKEILEFASSVALVSLFSKDATSGIVSEEKVKEISKEYGRKNIC